MNNEQKSDLIPCFLCGNGLEIKSSKRNKPYFTCDECGIQTFIRGQRGIKSFQQYKTQLNNGGILSSGKNNLQITALINRLAELKGKLFQLEGYPTIIEAFRPTPEEKKELPVRVLYQAIRQIQSELEEFTAQ